MSASPSNLFVNDDAKLGFVGRLLLGLMLGLAITFMLFFLMQTLISTGASVFDENSSRHVVDFIRLNSDQEVVTKDRKPKKPPPIQNPPPATIPQQISALSTIKGAKGNISMDVAMETDFAGGSGFDLVVQDGEYLPIIQVAPVYPRRAQNRGVEGYVVVELTVTKSGAVLNPVVIESQPSGTFDRAALRAAEKFKYKPRIVAGEAVAVSGVTYKFTFALDR